MFYVKYILTFINFILQPYYWLCSYFFQSSQSYSTKIIGSGYYLPSKHLSNEELLNEIDQSELQEKYIRECSKKRVRRGLSLAEFITSHYGISKRYKANEQETNSYMGAEACKKAMIDASVSANEIDFMIYAAASMDKIIPDTSTRIHKLLNLPNTPATTVHSTCISFMHALNMADAFIKSGTYKTIMIVSAEKLSLTTNPKDIKTHAIMGDVAAAVILQRTQNDPSNGNSSKINITKFSTLSEHCEKIECNVGNMMHPCVGNYSKDDYYFKTDSFDLISKAPILVANFLLSLCMNYSHVVIHQPSKVAIHHAELMFGKENITETFDQVGNCAGASIPFNLHVLLSSGKVKRGENIMIIGLGAGLGIGCINLTY